MGQFWSKRQQNYHHHHHHHHHRLHPRPPPPPPPPQLPQQPPLSSSSRPSSYAFAANAPYPAVPPPPPPPPTPPPPYISSTSAPYYNNNYNYNYSNYSRPAVNLMGPQSNYHNPYYVGHGNGWFRAPPPAMLLPPLPPSQPMPPAPVPYVDHQSAKKIKNDVNVHKDTIKLEVDEENKDCHLVSFTFDAMVDGSITIYYFAKEGAKCTFTPNYPEIHVPMKISFQKGLGQKFCQPSGSGIDFGFFDIDDLSKPSAGDVFPLVISAESCLVSTSADDQSNEEVGNTSPHAQITQAVIEKNNEDHFEVKVIKQILWIDEARYELREIFGISDSDERAINDNDSGKECVICMTEPKDTAILPCRHMCLCSECAKELRLQTNKCPICRQPIEELLEIKVDEAEA